MDHKKKIKANLKPGKGNKIQFYKNGKPLGVAFEEINDGVYYPAVSLFKSAKVTTSIVHGGINLLTSLNPRVKTFRSMWNFPLIFMVLLKKLFSSQGVTFGYFTDFFRFEQTSGQNGRNLLKMVKNLNQ